MQLFHFHHCKRHLKKRTVALDPLPPSVRCVRSWKWWQLWTTPYMTLLIRQFSFGLPVQSRKHSLAQTKYSRTHTHTHTRTHARTHAHTHTHTHTQTHAFMFDCVLLVADYTLIGTLIGALLYGLLAGPVVRWTKPKKALEKSRYAFYISCNETSMVSI